MFRRLLQKCIVALVLLQTTAIYARENTHIEGFIERVKLTNRFVTVSDIWQPDNNFDKKELLKNVSEVQPLTISYLNLANFMHQKSTAINLVIPVAGGESYTLELARYDFLTNDFEVHSVGENGANKLESYTPGLYYRGVVKGVPGSVVAFSFFNNEVYGLFSIPNVGNFVLVPNTMVGEDYNYNQHYIVYNDQDLLIKDRAPQCHADELPRNDMWQSPAAKTTTTLNNKVYVNCKEVRSMMVADYSMYVRKGSSVTNCTNYITSLYNNISVLYKNEGIMTVLKYVQVNTATDPYQTLPAQSNRWLTKFGYVTSTSAGGLNGCDLAMLLTTKYGSMGGIAWLGVMCAFYNPTDSLGAFAFCNINNSTSTSVPAFPTYGWDVNATTHEMGHNLGSPHTHRCCWNPPARITAIDKCYTLEGTCANPSPLYPSGGGTIMSYCHLQSVGVNLSNGFGQQPGDTVRFYLKGTGSSCGNVYRPDSTLTLPNKTVVANNECTDLTTGITYYWKDANTAKHSDDTLVLMIKKNGNNIGNLNSTAFNVSMTTLASYGGGTGVNVSFPSGTSGVASAGNNYSMRRYFNITPVGSTSLSTAVNIGIPITAADTNDVNGSVPGPTAPLTNFRTYIAKSPIDANPSGSFPSASASDITVCSYSSGTPTTGRWYKYPTTGNCAIAMMQVTRLGGGGAFYANGSVSGIGNINEMEGVDIFPNPTNTVWNIVLPESSEQTMDFQLYSADGRMVQSQVLHTGTINAVNAGELPTGMYFFRMVSGGKVYTGNLMKY
jgi:hypothetical protein